MPHTRKKKNKKKKKEKEEVQQKLNVNSSQAEIPEEATPEQTQNHAVFEGEDRAAACYSQSQQTTLPQTSSDQDAELQSGTSQETDKDDESVFTDENRNFFRLGYFAQDTTADILQRVITQFCAAKNLTFRHLLDQEKHHLFHLSSVRRAISPCCDPFACRSNNAKPMKEEQWNLMYENISTQTLSTPHQHGSNVCHEHFQPRTDVDETICDVTLALILITNIPDIRRYIAKQIHHTGEKFLETFKHELFHCMEAGKCCQCSDEPTPTKLLRPAQWNTLFNESNSGCGQSICSCKYRPQSNVDFGVLESIILPRFLWRTEPFITIREIRNRFVAHLPKASIEGGLFQTLWDDLEMAVGDELLNTVDDKKYRLRQRQRINDIKTQCIDAKSQQRLSSWRTELSDELKDLTETFKAATGEVKKLTEDLKSHLTETQRNAQSPSLLFPKASRVDLTVSNEQSTQNTQITINLFGRSSLHFRERSDDETEDGNVNVNSECSPETDLPHDVQNVSSNPYDFVKQVKNFQNGRFILIVGKMRKIQETRLKLRALARINWLCVFDFDIDSRSSGLLRQLECDEMVIQTCTWRQEPMFSSSFTQWCLLQGSVDEPGSFVRGETCKAWAERTFSGIECHLDRLNEYLQLTPLQVVIVWPDKDQNFLDKFINRLEDNLRNQSRSVTLISDESSDTIKRFREMHVDFSICCPLGEFCNALLRMTKMRIMDGEQIFRLPSEDGNNDPKIDFNTAAMISKDLSVLYLDNSSCKRLEHRAKIAFVQTFLSGGLLDWCMYYYKDYADTGDFDVRRDITEETVKMINEEYIEKSRSEIINIFHAPGSGGTTFARRVLWELHKYTPSAQLKLNTGSSMENIVATIEMLYRKTFKPIVLLIDGGEQFFVDLLLLRCRKNDTVVVILNLKRFHTRLPKRGVYLKNKSVWLPVHASEKEAVAFKDRYTEYCKNNERRHALDDIVDSTKQGQTNPIYMFGITTFMEEYKGVGPLVRGYLQFNPNERKRELHPLQRILGYLSLVYVYGQVSLPCQLFATLLGKSSKRPLGKDAFQSVQDLVIFEESERMLMMRICHQIVAVEILEQVLTFGLPAESKKEHPEHLSEAAKVRLFPFCKDFIKDISHRLESSQLKNGGILIDVLIKTFIQRDYKEVGAGETTYSRKKFAVSRLLTDIDKNKPFHKRVEIMEKIVECFPNNPSFRAHLGRMYSNCLQDEEEKAEECYIEALKLCASKRSSNADREDETDNEMKQIQHMYGVFCCRKIEKLTGKDFQGRFEGRVEDFDEVISRVLFLEREACKHFQSCRDLAVMGNDELYAYTGEIHAKLLVLQYIHQYTPLCDAIKESSKLDSKAKNYICESLPYVLELFSLCFFYNEDLEEASLSQFRKNLQVFKSLYVNFPKAKILDLSAQYQDVETRRIKINAIKIAHDPLNIDSIPDEEIKEMLTELEKSIDDIERYGVQLSKKSVDLAFKDWINVIRKDSLSKTYSMKTVLERMRIWNDHVTSIDSTFYLFIVSSIIGFDTGNIDSMYEALDLKDQICKSSKVLNLMKPRSPKEWLGSEKGNVACLIPGRKVKRESESRSVTKDSAIHLRKLRGIISRDTKRRQTGKILLETHAGDRPIDIYFVPVLTKDHLIGPIYAGKRVEFVLGFTYSGGFEAYNVKLLNQVVCPRCCETVELPNDAQAEMCGCGALVQNSKNGKNHFSEYGIA